MVALYNKDTLFHDRLKVLENSIAVVAKVAFNDQQVFKPRINGNDKH